MSYIMKFQMPGVTREAFEGVARDNADSMKGIAQRGKEAGAIHHGFYESNGDMFVIDEWDSPESFQKFFESEAANIAPLMQQGGATGQPEPRFWEKLDTGDAF